MFARSNFLKCLQMICDLTDVVGNVIVLIILTGIIRGNMRFDIWGKARERDGLQNRNL